MCGNQRTMRSLSVATRNRGFTILELLVVVSIIIILAVILVMVWPMVQDNVVRFRCSINLAKCQRIMFEYGANNDGYLPPMSGANSMGVITYPKTGRHYVVEALKDCGADASIFTCPATEDYDNPKSYRWNSWTTPRTVTQGSGQVLQVYTSGYVFFIGFWPWLDDNRRLNSHFYESGGQLFADRVDSPGDPPLGADLMEYVPSNAYGKIWPGWYHRDDTTPDAPGGGGHTLWLSGAVEWVSAEELIEAAEADPPTQPIYHGADSWKWYYFARWRPKDENSTPD